MGSLKARFWGLLLHAFFLHGSMVKKPQKVVDSIILR